MFSNRSAVLTVVMMCLGHGQRIVSACLGKLFGSRDLILFF